MKWETVCQYNIQAPGTCLKIWNVKKTLSLPGCKIGQYPPANPQNSYFVAYLNLMRLTTRKSTGPGDAVSVLIWQNGPVPRESAMVVAHVYFVGRLFAGRRNSCSFVPYNSGLVHWQLRQLVSINVHTIPVQIRKQAMFIYIMQRGSPWKHIFRSDNDQHKKPTCCSSYWSKQ